MDALETDTEWNKEIDPLQKKQGFFIVSTFNGKTSDF